MHFSVATILALAPAVLGHGLITTPPSRPVGSAIVSNCNQAIATNIKQDNTSHVEGLPELAAKDTKFDATKCNLWLCKGLQYDDNKANVQSWTAGQEVPIKIWLRIPHEGSANVSIVDTKSNKIVGDMLKVWAKGYAPGRSESDVPLDQKEFTIKVPTGLEEKCANAGDCVLQWWWYGTGAKQTYESCVDFKITKPALQQRAFTA